MSGKARLGASDAIRLVVHFGVQACAFQAGYRIRRRLGLLRRSFPAVDWGARGLPYYVGHAIDERRSRAACEEAPFFFEPGDVAGPAEFLAGVTASERSKILEEADDVVAGRFRYFADRVADLGTPPDWCQNPFTGQRADPTVHWCDLPDFAPSQGDVKFLWEASRFGWAYGLVRAYALTSDERYPEAFWRHFEAWLAQNQPNLGPQWKCGQECAFRLMAVCFAVRAFARSVHSTDARIARAAGVVAFHAERIEGNIAFAWSIKNNHGISEALGLFTAGVVLPGASATARWRAKGWRLLEAEARRQIAADGSFVQQSHNYHRVMLQDYAWALSLASVAGQVVSADVRDRVAAAARFLAAMLDLESGDVPNYGSNDGAHVLPLAPGSYRDYRPAIQAAHLAATGRRVLPTGPWDEEACWLLGEPALNAPVYLPPARCWAAPDGGYFTLRGDASWAMVRCHTFRDRPAHADMLHLDLWWHGTNVLQDSGTFQYFSPEPWEHAFKGTASHNTVMVDGQDQMRLVGRFLWVGWTRSKLLRHESLVAGAEVWEGEHLGYEPVTHRRSVVRLGDEAWVVIDDLLGTGDHDLALHWHLADAPLTVDAPRLVVTQELVPGLLHIAVVAPSGAALEVVRGAEDGRGWRSLHYGAKLPAPSVSVAWRGGLPARFVTLIGLGAELQFEMAGGQLAVQCAQATWELALAAPGEQIVTTARRLGLADPEKENPCTSS